jgi:hypothetical protein
MVEENEPLNLTSPNTVPSSGSVLVPSADVEEDETKKFKKGFIFGMALNVGIGMLQFGKNFLFNFIFILGFALGSWNLL